MINPPPSAHMLLAAAAAAAATLIAIYKRWHAVDGKAAFSLKFGDELLSPHFKIFSVLTALAICMPLNFKVAYKAYRDVTNAVEEERAKREFLRDFKKNPLLEIVRSNKRFSKDCKVDSEAAKRLSNGITFFFYLGSFTTAAFLIVLITTIIRWMTI